MITTTMPTPWVFGISVGLTLYAAYWAFRAFVPRKREQCAPGLKDRSEGSLRARRRRLLFIVSPIAALALLIVSRVGGPAVSRTLIAWVFGWVMIFDSIQLRVTIIGVTMLLWVMGLVGALRDTASWLNERPERGDDAERAAGSDGTPGTDNEMG